MRYSQLLDNINSPDGFESISMLTRSLQIWFVYDTAATQTVNFRSFFGKKGRFWVVSQGNNHGPNPKPNPNPSNPFRMVRICIQMNGISFEEFEMDSNASNPFRMVRIWIRMLRIPFEWFEFPFECSESLSKGSNFHSNASKLFRIVRTWIRMLQIPFESFEFGFECFESLSNG